jgi:hypothetical protein
MSQRAQPVQDAVLDKVLRPVYGSNGLMERYISHTSTQTRTEIIGM